MCLDGGGLRDCAKLLFCDLMPVMTRVIKIWQASYLNRFSPEIRVIGVKLETTVWSGSKNRFACSKSYHGKVNRWKTRIERKTNRRPPWIITVCSKQICRKRKGKFTHDRKLDWSFGPDRSNGNFPYKRTRQQSRNTQSLLPNMHSHQRKRLNVFILPKRNASTMGGKLSLLPLN